MHDHTDRLARLRRRLRGRAMYVSALPNIRYLTGFTGSTGHLLVTPEETTLFTDGRYRLQASEQTRGIHVEISRGDSRPALVGRAGALPPATPGVRSQPAGLRHLCVSRRQLEELPARSVAIGSRDACECGRAPLKSKPFAGLSN